MKTLELTRVGEHRMEGGLYKDKDGNYYVDCHDEPKKSGVSVVYRLSPKNEIDGEPDKMIECEIKILNPLSEREERMKEFKFDYMMLNRMQMDCKYYDSAAHFNNSHASTIRQTIDRMKEIWNKFPEDLKPEWISLEEIEGYEKKFGL